MQRATGIGRARFIALAGLLATAGCASQAEPTPSGADVANAPLEWTGPVRQERVGAEVEMIGSLTSSEEADTSPRWVDIADVEIVPEFQNWRLELGLDHPSRDALSSAERVLAFGFVMDTTGDGVADYVVGVDSDAEAPRVHVWLTDLATGETQETSSGPYGDPFDFSTTLESEPMAGDPPRPPGGTFFNVGFAPPELFDHTSTRFYAWASLTENGEVVAWDYAPDRAWLGRTSPEQLGCTPVTCPVAGPAPGPGAREWIVNVENQSNRDARVFVAQDSMPMGDLVGTADPAYIPPGASQRVSITVPDGVGWAIFVSTTPDSGPLITAQDVPMDVTGVLPITIQVQSSGTPFVVSPAMLPGWFGN